MGKKRLGEMKWQIQIGTAS